MEENAAFKTIAPTAGRFGVSRPHELIVDMRGLDINQMSL